MSRDGLAALPAAPSIRGWATILSKLCQAADRFPDLAIILLRFRSNTIRHVCAHPLSIRGRDSRRAILNASQLGPLEHVFPHCVLRKDPGLSDRMLATIYNEHFNYGTDLWHRYAMPNTKHLLAP